MMKHIDTKHRIKSIFIGSVGNLVEWYDWYIYAAFSLYFAGTFFPQGNLTTQLLNTAAVFAVGFLMRPIGSWLLGIYADRKGRKAALMLSVLLMCLGSLMIAFAPSYQMVGIASPIILILARMIQGISAGGEYGASATYLSEMAESRYRGFYSSFQYVTMIMGQLLALGVLLLLQKCFLTSVQIEHWGWRIPFVIGALCSVIAMVMRRNIEETEIFKHEDKKKLKKNLFAELLKHPREIGIVIGLTIGGTLAFYTYTTYMQKFMVNTIGLSRDDATLISAITLFIFMVLQPLVGLLSDRIGRKPVLLVFGMLGALGTVPILTALGETQNFWVILSLLTLALVVVSFYTATNSIVKAELFPAEVRALGVGLPYALTVSIFGGTAEYIALYLKKIGHEPYFYWYVALSIGVSWIVYIWMPETKTMSRIDKDA